MRTDYMHRISYLIKDTGDVIHTIDIRSDDEDDTLLSFYCMREQMDLSAYEHDLFIKATKRLTMTETVKFYNILLHDCEIVRVEYITHRECYPAEE